MRHATVRNPDGTTNAIRVEGDTSILLDVADVGDLLRARSQGVAVAEIGERPLADADYAPLVVSPAKVICVGHNYRSHIEEMGRDLPAHPTLFAKFARTLAGARDPIPVGGAVDGSDWEAELAFVVGREIRNADTAEAASAIAGYTIANDVSARAWQFRTVQWLQGKAFEASTPLGPFLVSGDEVADAKDLHVRCSLDGEIVQSASTSDLLFTPVDLVTYISQIVTLDPGDVILTGTASGVGHARQPPQYLSPGFVLRTEIDGLGELVNECVAR